MNSINAKNWNEFLSEPKLYVAEPLIKATDSWLKFDEVPDKQKSKMLYFEALEGKKLYVAFLRKNEKSYAKLYISDTKNISILYVRSDAVNPVQSYRHVTKRKPK